MSVQTHRFFRGAKFYRLTPREKLAPVFAKGRKELGCGRPWLFLSRALPVQAALIIVLCGSLLGLAYTYLGYPTLLAVLARISGDASTRSASERVNDADLPEITVLIAAYNAQDHLVGRINNILDCDYPASRLSILVASDGSNDRTVPLIRDLVDQRINVIDFPSRCGKAATIVRAMEQVSTAVVVFTDASTRFDRESLKRLGRHFRDPHVGLVAGKISMVDDHGDSSESLYWKIETKLREWESRLGVTLGASGAIYAIRRSMFVAPARPIINDDLVLPMLVRLKHDCRLVFDSSAQAFALTGGGLQTEFARRQRIGIGAFQCLPVLTDLLKWRNRWHAAAFASHKLMRWTCPFLLITALISNWALTANPLFRTLLGLQVLCYATAINGLIMPTGGKVSRLMSTAASFLVMNAAIGVGICRWVFRPDTVIWTPTPRPQWQRFWGSSESQLAANGNKSASSTGRRAA